MLWILKRTISLRVMNIFLSISSNMLLRAQKNRLIETVLLSTQNIGFGCEITKLIFDYTLLSGGLGYIVCVHS